jgi:hypothetical protein
VAAAVELQRALNSHPWPNGSKVRVRVGIHTGEPSVGDEGLSGYAVHVASRICGVAHGGQILISDTTHHLVEDRLPARSGLRDLGEHLLKDIDRPARLFQLVLEELEEAFPPPRARNADTQVVPVRGQEREPLGAVASQRARAEPVHAEPRALRPRDALRAAVRRRFGRESIDHVGARIHSMGRLSPSSELGRALRTLGGQILQSARDERGAEHLLKSTDRRALQRRLEELRSASFLTERDAQLADGLARQVAAVERLASLRRALRAEITRIEARTEEIRQEVFAARLGDPLAENLVDEITAFSRAIRSFGRQLKQAKQEADHPIAPGRPASG